MTKLGARERLAAGRGRGVTVGVVDSGWSRELSDPRVLPGRDLLEDSQDGAEEHPGHGTLCALRILQVAPEACIVPVKVFPRGLETSVGVLCEGIRVAGESGAHVVNLSLATRLQVAVRPLFEVCEAARLAGVVIIAAAHNHRVPAVPAHLEPVLSVQEGPQTDLLDFSYDAGALIECTAAGSQVPVTAANGEAWRRAGSSIAAATMSGIVARLVEGADADLDQVRSLLQEITLARNAPPVDA
jgi:subtilisin